MIVESSNVDVVVADVSSLTDRRRIAALEAANADLEHKLAEATRVVRPSLNLERGACYHFSAPLVHDKEESVTCSNCAAELNPYEVLRKIAHREVNFCHQMNALRAEAEELAKEVQRLKATRSRLRREARAGGES